MKQTPCEHIVWHGLPVLRKEIAKCMINNFNLNEKETAEKLGITPAAVSQYLSGKRGNFDVTDVAILEEIKISAERIFDNGNGSVVPEICRLCKLFTSEGIFFVGDNKK
jgi:uncharacterized protein